MRRQRKRKVWTRAFTDGFTEKKSLSEQRGELINTQWRELLLLKRTNNYNLRQICCIKRSAREIGLVQIYSVDLVFVGRDVFRWIKVSDFFS